MMVNLAALPQQLNLQPIESVPLPQNWQVSVAPVAGWRPPGPLGYGLLVGSNTLPFALANQSQPGSGGFNQLAKNILGHVALHGLWGQTVPCQVVAENLSTQAYVAKSNVQTLALPTQPCFITHPRQLAYGQPYDTPAPVALASPSGRMLYFSRDPQQLNNTLPAVWFVRPDLTLETQWDGRGFDRFSFWLSTYGVALKYAQNVGTGEVLAQRLNAHKSRSVPASATLQAIGNACLVNNYFASERGLLWTGSRVVHFTVQSIFPYVAAMEFDGSGFHLQDLSAWLAQQDPGAVWQYRALSPASGSAPLYGVAGLPGYVAPPPIGALKPGP